MPAHDELSSALSTSNPVCVDDICDPWTLTPPNLPPPAHCSDTLVGSRIYGSSKRRGYSRDQRGARVLAAPHYVATAECSFSELAPSAKRMRRLLVNRGVATVESLS